MAEWDRDRERYEPERDFRRDYLRPGLGFGAVEARRGGDDWQRGVWTIGGWPWPRGGRGEGPHAGKGPKGYRRSDTRIFEDVCDRLERDPDLDATGIVVTVEEGEVTLAGTVDDRRARRLAEDAVAECPGVRDVHNRLRAAGQRPPSER
jgi:hypothetical protein